MGTPGCSTVWSNDSWSSTIWSSTIWSTTIWSTVPFGLPYRLVYCNIWSMTIWSTVPFGLLYHLVYSTSWSTVLFALLYHLVYCITWSLVTVHWACSKCCIRRNVTVETMIYSTLSRFHTTLIIIIPLLPALPENDKSILGKITTCHSQFYILFLTYRLFWLSDFTVVWTW